MTSYASGRTWRKDAQTGSLSRPLSRQEAVNAQIARTKDSQSAMSKMVVKMFFGQQEIVAALEISGWPRLRNESGIYRSLLLHPFADTIFLCIS